MGAWAWAGRAGERGRGRGRGCRTDGLGGGGAGRALARGRAADRGGGGRARSGVRVRGSSRSTGRGSSAGAGAGAGGAWRGSTRRLMRTAGGARMILNTRGFVCSRVVCDQLSSVERVRPRESGRPSQVAQRRTRAPSRRLPRVRRVQPGAAGAATQSHPGRFPVPISDPSQAILLRSALRPVPRPPSREQPLLRRLFPGQTQPSLPPTPAPASHSRPSRLQSKLSPVDAQPQPASRVTRCHPPAHRHCFERPRRATQRSAHSTCGPPSEWSSITRPKLYRTDA